MSLVDEKIALILKIDILEIQDEIFIYDLLEHSGNLIIVLVHQILYINTKLQFLTLLRFTLLITK